MMSKYIFQFWLIAFALAGTGVDRFGGVRHLAAVLRNTNAEFLVYFNNGNQIGLLDRGSVVPLNLETNLGSPGRCCPHHATPSLSPNGRSVAYVRLKSEQPRREVISVYDLSDKNERELFQAEMIWGISWSPDGKHLAVVADRAPEQSHNLYLINAVPDSPAQLSHGLLELEGGKYVVSDHAPPSWNTTGTQLAVEVRPEPAKTTSGSAIVLWDVAANRFHKLADGINPSWSPAQDLIAFMDSDAKRCFTIKSDGSDQKLLFAMGQGPFKSQSSAFFFPAVWSPDGKQMLFHKLADADMVIDIYKFDLLTGKTHHLGRADVQVVDWRESR